MKQLTLPHIRMYELATVVDALQPKDLGDLKSIRLASGIVNDFKAALKQFAELSDEHASNVQKLIKPFQDKFSAIPAETPQSEKDKLAGALDKELQETLKVSLGEQTKHLEEKGKEELTIELSDEKYAKLKELFEKYASEKYLNKEVLLKVADALGV